MVCKVCGETVEDGLEVCPVCGCRLEQAEAPVPDEAPDDTKQVKSSKSSIRLPESAALSAGLVLAALSFLLNIVIGSFMFARHASGMELFFLLPPFAALILGVFGFYKARENDSAVEKMFAFIAMGLALFAILFLFIAYCNLIA